MTEEEVKMVVLFVDLLDKCLQLNPERRPSVREILSHPFITGQTTATSSS
jgi:serine/threonine-protein kinase PRP4